MANQYEIKVKVKTDGETEIIKLGKSFTDTSADIVSASQQLVRVDAFKQLKKDVLDSQQAWSDATKKVKDLAVELKNTEAPTKKLTQEFEKSKKTAGILKDEYERNTVALASLRKGLSNSGIDTKKLGDEQARLKKELTESRKQLAENAKILNARNTIGIRSYQEIREEIKKLNDSYDVLRQSGKLTHAELFKAKTELRKKTAELITETNGWSQSIGMAKTSMVAIVGVGYTLMRAMSNVTGIMAESGKASFNLEASVRAANQEFSNTGSLNEWEDSVKRLSGELGIYSESSLKNAIARTIDMTKKFGLSAEQMEVVIARSGDLGAGKVELEGAVERVTAALRGEAESAEYLGLTLNENYVKGWYNAKEGQDKAWSSLTEVEKAQVRYQVFLEQSEGMHGRAADSVKTYAGAMASVKKEIEDSISNNTDMVAALNEVAKVLKENSGQIANVISGLVSLFAKLIEGAADVVGWFGNMSAGTVAVTSSVSSFVIAGLMLRKVLASDLATAFGGMIAHMKDGKAGMVGMEASSKSLAASLRGGLYMALAATVFQTVKGFLEMRDAQNEADDAAKRLAVSEKALADKLKVISQDTGMNITTSQELTKAKREGLIVLDQETHKWRATTEAQRESILASDAAMAKEREVSAQRLATHDAFVASIDEQGNTAIAKAQEQADAKVLTEKEASEKIIGLNLAKYQQLLAAADQHVADVGRVEGVGSDNYKKAVEDQKSAAQKLKEYKVQAAQEITNRLKNELNTQLSDEKRIQGEIEALHQKASDQLVLKEDELREIRRRGMTDVQQQADLEKQANEKLLEAKAALAAGDFERASKLASQSKDISKGLKDEGEAIAGVKSAWGVLEDVTKGQESTKQAELKKTQDATKQLKDDIVNVEKAVASIAAAFKSVNLQLAAEPIKPTLDDSELKKGLDIHSQLNGKHTESEHIIHFKGEGSAEKPISEKIKDLKELLAQYRQAAALGATSITQFTGKDTGGETGLTEKIKDLEKQIADLQKQIETPVELKVDTTKAKAAIEDVKTTKTAAKGSQTEEEEKKKAAKDAEAKRGTGLIADREIDDSKHRPEKDAAAYEVDEALAQQIDNKKTEMSLYQQAADSSAKSGDGLYSVYVNRVNELFNQIQALEREMEEKKKKTQKTSSGTMRLNSGGYVPGFGSTDTVPAMLTPREFVQPAPTVRMYGADYMEALRRRRISVAAVRAQMSGAMFNAGGLVRAQSSFRVPSLPDIRPMGFNAGGMVPAAGGAGQVLERIQVDLNIGGNVYSGLFKKSEARGMIEELKRAKARSL